MEKIMGKGKWQNRWMGDMAMGECENKQRKSCIAQMYCTYFQWRYGRL